MIGNKDLLRTQQFVGGKWLAAADGTSYGVSDPATGETIAEVPNSGAEDAKSAVSAAKEAFGDFAALTAKERSRLLVRWNELILANGDDLAMLVTREMGKPLAEAKGEVAYGSSFVEWFAEEAKRTYGDVIPGHQPDKRIHVIKQPVGVCAAITPWNFPIAMITRKVAPALAVGCTVVIKPAAETPLAALALSRLAEEAGFPPGTFNLLTSSRASEIGSVWTSSPDVRKLTFTGSTEVGKKLYEQCASNVKKLSLELGGNAPFIVFDDADLEAAVEGAVMCKFRNTGQTCVCANRIFVQDGVYDRFAEMLCEKVSAFKVGPGTEDGVVQGPLVNGAGLEKVKEHVADATDKGAEVLVGGKPHELGGLFYTPTVLTGVTPEMDLNREETFGPVAPLIRFKDRDEVIEMANDTPFGLAAYFYSRDLANVHLVSERLEAGIVGVNTGIISTEVAPFGGYKESGVGREGSRYGTDEFLETKYVCLGGIE